MKQKPKKSTVAGLLLGVAMAVSYGLILGPVGLALGMSFAFLSKTMFCELDGADESDQKRELCSGTTTEKKT